MVGQIQGVSPIGGSSGRDTPARGWFGGVGSLPLRACCPSRLVILEYLADKELRLFQSVKALMRIQEVGKCGANSSCPLSILIINQGLNDYHTCLKYFLVYIHLMVA